MWYIHVVHGAFPYQINMSRYFWIRILQEAGLHQQKRLKKTTQNLWRTVNIMKLQPERPSALYSGFRKLSPWQFSHGSFQRACVPVGSCMLPFSGTGDVAMSWLAVETSDVPYVLKLASGVLASWAAGDTVSRLESSWDGPVYTAATFPATVWSHQESLLQTGLKERERQQTR